MISPSQIGSLRDNPDSRHVRIVGTDMYAPCSGQFLTDSFYVVPSGTSADYIQKMIEICRKESVDVLFPASHEEGLTLSINRKLFEDIGTKIAISRWDVLELSFNKKEAYNRLKNLGIACPEFKVARNIDEFQAAADALGINHKSIVMKPVLSRGGRGTRILSQNNTVRLLLNQKPGYLEANYQETLRALGTLEDSDFPELILMEYLSGQIYSVDFLAMRGKAMMIVPKVRIAGNASQTIIGQVNRNKTVEDLTSKISEAFGFDYTINIEMGLTDDGYPLPFDFNPRIAASVAFCTAAGVNLIYYALKLALGENVPQLQVKDKVWMFRYFKEIYA
ncbi:MAG: ATP-grasp domain-containing protein [Candidatus Bathyarchaeia archaeon]